MTKFEAYVTREIGNFIWDGFTDPAGVGVRLEDVLDGAALVGVSLTDAQKNSVLDHTCNPDDWDDEDEIVRDLIADATDLMDYELMHDWLICITGDTTAADLEKEWEDEAQDILDRFDRKQDGTTMTVQEWRDAYKDDSDMLELLSDEAPEALAVQYHGYDPLSLKLMPWEASTEAEKRLCLDLYL